MSNTGAGTYLFRHGNYTVKRMFGMYRIYNKSTGLFIGQAPTMRKARNMIRNVLIGKPATTEGRE